MSKTSQSKNDFKSIIESETKFNKIQDLDILLECILAEACRVVSADAGSIYLVEGDRLAIKYSRNDTKQKELPPGQKMIYSFFSFPINKLSIAGYCASTGTILNVPDVYAITPDKPYSFHSETDVISGYKTKSNMAIPLKSAQGKLLGVIQVLNKKTPDGQVVSFDSDDELFVGHFAVTASNALEHAALTRSMVMRMIKLSQLRDPKETGSHVNRVASYSVEVYDRWAFNKKIEEKVIHSFRDSLKIAAMLHDVGKVGISDMILKKPARFTPEEYEIMKSHTRVGATLFDNPESELDLMSRDVALTHHENWDGTGYPGWIDPFTDKVIKGNDEGKPLGRVEDEIPLVGRIVAIADVFDALSSKRVYKDAWTEDDVLAELKNCRGTKFDPDVVDAFFEVLPNIEQIQKAFPD